MKLKYVPWMLVVVGVWLVLRTMLVPVLSNPLWVVVLIAAIVGLVVEFFKSGDIGLTAFRVDLVWALLAAMAVAAFVAYTMASGGTVYLLDYVLGGIVVVEAWLSPVNSFRTALRNWSGSVSAAAEGGE